MQGWFSKLSGLKTAGLGLLCFLGGTGVPPIYQAVVSHHFAEQQAAADKVEKSLRDFRDAAAGFDHLVASFVIALS